MEDFSDRKHDGAIAASMQDGNPPQNGAYPAAPNPSADPGVIPRIDPTPKLDSDEPSTPGPDLDVTTMEPLAAMKLLARAIQVLADMTGDIPPTPPISRPGTPSIHDIRNELLNRPRAQSRPSATPAHIPCDDITKLARQSSLPIGAPEAHPMEPSTVAPISNPTSSSTANDSAAHTMSTTQQRAAISRKFFSKKPPPISVSDYLHRLHRYCPMSTGVYLAAGHYIHRLALLDRIVPVTSRTVHRLLLASLRVAMKALEDLSYPHKRFAGVGGVGERELAKLEVCLCYLMEFELRVELGGLVSAAGVLRGIAEGRGGVGAAGVGGMGLEIPLRERGRRGTVV